jgi:AcrR family transcriptional regulator
LCHRPGERDDSLGVDGRRTDADDTDPAVDTDAAKGAGEGSESGVAGAAGDVGLGAVYRRWPDKRALVLDAMRGAVSQLVVAPTDDPVADLVRGLDLLAEAFGSRSRPLLGMVLGGQDGELSEVIREAKILPLHIANRERVRRVLGDVPDLATRADLGPALVLLDMLVRGRPPSKRRIREEIVPLILGGSTAVTDPTDSDTG